MKFFIYLILFFFLIGCNPYNKYEDMVKSRAENSLTSNEVSIGVTWPFCLEEGDNHFLEGIQLALKEINEDGGVLGKKVKIITQDDKCSLLRAKQISKDFADNLDIIAVIGHEDAELAIPASITYEYNGIVFISPAISYPLLTRDANRYIFRNTPNDIEIGKALAKFSKKINFKKMIILYSNNFYGNSLSGIFREEAIGLDIEIIHQRSFSIEEKSFREIIALLKDSEFDAIFLAGTDKNAPFFIKKAREMDITVPILTGSALDSKKLIEVAKDKADGVIVATIYNPNKLGIKTKNFIYEFKKEYKKEPDTWAIQGYDALKVLINAIEEAKTTIPYEIAQTLRYKKNWDGAVGKYSFTKRGDIVGREIFFKVAENKKFHYLDVK